MQNYQKSKINTSIQIVYNERKDITDMYSTSQISIKGEVEGYFRSAEGKGNFLLKTVVTLSSALLLLLLF